MANPITSLVSSLLKIGSDPDDNDRVRLQKRLLVAGSSLVILATAVWGATYLIYGEPAAASISLFNSVITILLLFGFRATHQTTFFIRIQLVMGLFLPFLDMLALGGFMNSSGVILWSMISALGASFFYTFRAAMRYWLAYFGLLAISGLLQPTLHSVNHLPQFLVTAFFVMNIAGVSFIVLLLLTYFMHQEELAYHLLHIEQQKAENLLLNILPKEIAAILKNEQRTIAEQFEGASVLFADLVGFTPLSAQMSPVEMVNLLNEIFSSFDDLVEKYQVEKIRTIGDNYMVASGVPVPRGDHARALASMALEMREYLEKRPTMQGRRIEFRIGINSGPMIGGVIGRKKFVYDIWGDAVNIASRMESHGLAGKIQITQATYELIHPWFVCEPRGAIPVKGRGEVITYFLCGLKPVE
jgi:adenylate cyclase